MYFFLLCKIQDIFHLAQRLTDQYAFFLVKKKHSMVYCLQTMLEMLSLFLPKAKNTFFQGEKAQIFLQLCRLWWKFSLN